MRQRRLLLLVVAGLAASSALIVGSALVPRSGQLLVPDGGKSAASAAAAAEETVQQALTAAQAEVRRSPGDTSALVRLADTYLQADRSADAERMYAKVLRLDEGNVEARAGLAMVRVVRGQPKQAIADLKRLAGRHPEQQTVLYDLAIAYYVTNQRELARETWRRVVELDEQSEAGLQAAQFLSIMKPPGAGASPSSP